MQRSLAASSIACAQRLDQLSSLLKDPDRAQLSALEQSAAEDQSTRFQVWAGNLGAFQRLPATASLDHRLRESPRIATQIHDLLEDLQTSADDGATTFCAHNYMMLITAVRAIVVGERPNRRSEPDVEPENSNIDSDDFPEHGSTDENDESETELPDLSEAEEIFESIKDTIASLFRLAVMIRKATPRDRYTRALGGRNPFIEDFDIAHVGHKFEKLNNDVSKWLRERLGKAITQRRQYLRYAREHRYKLGKEPAGLWKPIADIQKGKLQIPVDLSASQAGRTDTSRPATTLADTTASTLFLQETTFADRDFQDDQSQTSFAFSALDEGDDNRMNLPRLSEVAKGQASFECPFCWTIQTFRKEKAWKKHALSDLRPYICTFEDCDLKMFPDRKTWFEHEMKLHRAKWHCHFCGHSSFKTSKAFCEHVRGSHGTDGNQDQLDALAEASKQPLTQFTAADCPFCPKWDADLRISNPDIPQNEKVFVTATDLRRHIGSHMQDLALFAIPRGYLEEGEGDAASKASARAAGVGKDNLSIAVSHARDSIDSFESTMDLTTYRKPVDPIKCADTIEAAMQQPGTAFEEALITILPALNDNELQELHSRLPISERIGSSSKQLFASIAHLVACGQREAERTWFRTWHAYPQNSEMWWDRARSVVTGYARHDARLKYVHPHIEQYIDNAFEGGYFSPLFCRILRQVAIQEKTSSMTLTPEEDILNDIKSLRSKPASALGVIPSLSTRSNRYLRKLVRTEKKRYSESSIFSISSGPRKYNHSVEFEGEDKHLFQNLLGHLFASAMDPVAQYAQDLYQAFQTYSTVTSNESGEFQSLVYQILNLHWRKDHLRAVKSMFEDEYSATVESFVEQLHDFTGRDDMFIPLLKALVDVDTGEDMVDYRNADRSQTEAAEDISMPHLPSVESSLRVAGDSSRLIRESDLPIEPTPQRQQLSIYRIALLKIIALRKRSSRRKESTLQRLLQTIPSSEESSDTHAWIGRLLNYPIFQKCPTFFGSIKPFVTLRVYQADEIILAKGEAATWAGWLIVGRTTYIATYNPDEQARQGRRQWKTSENTLTYGLIGTLLNLPSLSHNLAETDCVVAQIPRDDFRRLVQQHKEVEQHLEAEEFGTSFAVARECLRIEVAFGKPWWYIFDPWEAASMDLTTATSKVLEDADDPKIIASLVRNIGKMQYTPLDLVLKNKNVEAAKLLLESGAEVRSTTIKVALDNDDADFVELLLTRPGAAEVANELLRSADDVYTPKLQTMLKKMQGRVSLVTAASLEPDMKPDIPTSPREAMEPDRGAAESGSTESEAGTHETTLFDGKDQGGLATGGQDLDPDEPQDVVASFDETTSSQASNSDTLAKKTMWASPLGSIRRRWVSGMASINDQIQQQTPSKSTSDSAQPHGPDADMKLHHDDSAASPSSVPVGQYLGPDSPGPTSVDPDKSPITFEQESSMHDTGSGYGTSMQSAPTSQVASQGDLPFSSDEFWDSLYAFRYGCHNYIEIADRLSGFLDRVPDKSLAASLLSTNNPEHGESPLIFALKYGPTDLVESLLQWGANANSVTTLGQYPLDIAYPRSHPQITALLLEYGAVKFEGYVENKEELLRIQEAYDGIWFDFVHGARGSQDDRATVRRILSESIDPLLTVNLRRPDGPRALDIAVENNDIHVVELLLLHGAESGSALWMDATLAGGSIEKAVFRLLQSHGVVAANRNFGRIYPGSEVGESESESENEIFSERGGAEGDDNVEEINAEVGTSEQGGQEKDDTGEELDEDVEAGEREEHHMNLAKDGAL